MNTHLKHTRPVVAIVLASIVAFAAGACSSGQRSGSKGVVTIKNFAFAPSPTNARAGQALTIRNDDDTTPSFTADDGSFDSGPIGAGQTKAVTPRAAGTIHYHCSIHTYMMGTLSVSR